MARSTGAEFKKAVLPVFEELYDRVASGKECTRVLSACGAPNYQEQLAKELAEMGNSEMWRAGAASRALRPKNRPGPLLRGPRASPAALENDESIRRDGHHPRGKVDCPEREDWGRTAYCRL